MYLDRHDAQGVTAEAIAEAHRMDVAVEAQYGVHYHTYWFDPARGSVFCLAEGPSREAIEAVHREAHGQLASVVVEIDPDLPLNALFGELPNEPVGTPYTATAIRAIVFTDICGSVALTQELGDDASMQLVREHDEIVRAALEGCDGREVKHTGDGIMAAFTSISAAINFGIEVQRRLHERDQRSATPLAVSIGISAGEPLTEKGDDLFGAAVQLAARLCAAAVPREILVSLAVRELCAGKPFRFVDRGELELKGLPQPAAAYAVEWVQ